MTTGFWAGEGERSGGPHGRAAPGRGPNGQVRRPIILVVDDDAAILSTVTDILASEGWNAVGVASGQEAVASLRTQRPAVILLDMRMPGMDGWTVARHAREIVPGVPIVVMTAAENAARWADEVAAEAYLAKPFDIDELLARVEPFRGGGRPN
jgi:DNA-binding response OmpR family regulator